MPWIALLVAGLFETCFAVALKLSDGFSRPIPTAVFAVCAVASFALLSWSLRSLPVGTAYAVWTGIGAVGTAIVGMVALDEPTDIARIAAITLVIAGVAGLRLTSGGH